MKRLIALAIVAGIGLTACANPDKSRDDAQDTLNVDHSPPRVFAFNNHYPNVETKCGPKGFRVFVTTHDSAVGRNVIVEPDANCP